MGVVLLGASGLVLVACGRSGRNQPSLRATSDGGSPGGPAMVAAGVSVGAASGSPSDPGAGGRAGEPEAGAGGAPNEAFIVGLVEHRYTGEPVAGELVVIDGVSYMSDEQGLVHAPAPLGTYDAMVLHAEGQEHDVFVYEQLTHQRPVFYVGKEPASPPAWSAVVNATFSGQPAGTGEVSFTMPGAVFDSTSAGDGSFYMSRSWRGRKSLAGVLHGLSIDTSASGEVTGYWYGSAEVTLVGGEPAQQVDLTATLLPARPLDLWVEGESNFEGSLFFGPRFIGVTTHNPKRFVVPDVRPLAGVGAVPQLVLACGQVLPVKLSVPLPSDVNELTVTCPPRPVLVSPAIDAVVSREAEFQFEAESAPCRHVWFTVPGLSLSVFTTRDRVRLPDLSAIGVAWPTSVGGIWSMSANGPCAGTDFYVSPETALHVTSPGVRSDFRTPGSSLIESRSSSRPFTIAPP